MKIILINTIIILVLALSNCTTTNSNRPFAGIPEINEKITVGPQLSGSACSTKYLGGLFWSDDHKGYARLNFSTSSEAESLGVLHFLLEIR